MNAKQLRSSILLAAVQGKLVDQNPHDEPVSFLLERIAEEKNRLIKEKKIKKPKSTSRIFCKEGKFYESVNGAEPVCIDDELPFEIPESWEWARIKTISESYIGLTYKPEQLNNKGIPVLRSNNIKNGHLVLDDLVRVQCNISKKLFIENNDIIICARNGSKKLVGKSALIRDLKEPMTFGAFMAICKTQIYSYVYIFLQSDLFFNQLAFVSGTTTINQLTQNKFNEFLIPVPPLTEQERIVRKIKELSPFIQEYDSKEQSLRQLHQAFPQQLKKSILQAGIQGKLVPQDKNDEAASVLLDQIAKEKAQLIKEKKIKKPKSISRIFRKEGKFYESINGGEAVCIDDELPFDIPESWEWARLDSVCTYIQRGKSPKYSEIQQIPVIAQKCVQWSGFELFKAKFIDPVSINKYDEERFLKENDLLWNSTGLGTLGRICLFPKINYEITVADSHVTVIRPFKRFISPLFIYNYLSNPSVQNVIERQSDGSTKQKELSTATIKHYLIPIPPLNEQKRIVKEIEMLLEKIEKLP